MSSHRKLRGAPFLEDVKGCESALQNNYVQSCGPCLYLDTLSMKACLVELQLLYIYCLCNVHRSFFSLSSLLFSYSRWELVKPKEQASSALTGSMRGGERREKKSSCE
jgi:hypothetical protein